MEGENEEHYDGVPEVQHDVTCFCGNPAQLMVSWTDRNPGRRFFRCREPEVS